MVYNTRSVHYSLRINLYCVVCNNLLLVITVVSAPTKKNKTTSPAPVCSSTKKIRIMRLKHARDPSGWHDKRRPSVSKAISGIAQRSALCCLVYLIMALSFHRLLDNGCSLRRFSAGLLRFSIVKPTINMIK